MFKKKTKEAINWRGELKLGDAYAHGDAVTIGLHVMVMDLPTGLFMPVGKWYLMQDYRRSRRVRLARLMRLVADRIEGDN